MIARQVALVVSLLLNVVLVYSLVWGEQGVLAYRRLKTFHDRLTTQIAELDEKNILLSQEIRLLQSDDKYVEKVVRNRLNYVRETEILYIFPEQKAHERPGVAADETKD